MQRDLKPKEYSAVRISDNQLNINGKVNHSAWKKAKGLIDFCSPWDDEEVRKIEFKALWDASFLYCSFKVQDAEVYINKTDNIRDSINDSDRVELFLRSNKNLDPYYCLEIDPTARLMDFKAKPNKEFDFDWSWPKKDIMIKSDIQKDYFTVEIAISLVSLTQMDLLKDGKIEMGIYRAKYNKQENENYKPTWITWVNPNTKTPNFHTPTSFGIFKLEGY